MKIEDGKTASDALAGCAPIDWVKSVMSDFRYAWEQTIVDVKQLWNDFWYGARGVWESVTEAWDWVWGKITNIPVVREIVNGVSYGIGIVKKGWQGLDKCTKTLIKGTAAVVGGVAAIAGGVYALCAIGGFVVNSVLVKVGITVTAGALLGLFAVSVRNIYNFNWNVTDEALEANYKQKLRTIAGMAGETIGTAIGGATCGWLVGTTIGRFNPVLAAKIKMVMPEIWEEVKEQFDSFLRLTGRMSIGIMFMDIYKNVRRWIKKNAARIPGISPKFQEAIKAWGAPGSEAWSFAIAVEKKVESIQNPILQSFTEELVEGFFDSCSESIFTLSAGLS